MSTTPLQSGRMPTRCHHTNRIQLPARHSTLPMTSARPSSVTYSTTGLETSAGSTPAGSVTSATDAGGLTQPRNAVAGPGHHRPSGLGQDRQWEGGGISHSSDCISSLNIVHVRTAWHTLLAKHVLDFHSFVMLRLCGVTTQVRFTSVIAA